MRLVIQRVGQASVQVVETRKTVGKIGPGLLVLLGVGREDTEVEVDFLVEKLAKLRILADDQDKMNRSVLDLQAPVLVVSQFTLQAETSKGNRPSFIKAAAPEKAQTLCQLFVKKLKEKGVRVQTGSFGDYMKIRTELDGPVTIILEK